LRGKQHELKEQTIAMAVFDKPVSFDPRLDPIVRVEARRLRGKLLEYYATEGVRSKCVIQLDRRGYVPRFETAPHVAKVRPQLTELRERPNGRDVGSQSTVAVLPLVNLSPNPELEHFCDGLTEEIINALAQVKGLQVVSRSSSFQFKGPAHDVREVGERLGVGVVMEGSVRQAGDYVRITVQLNNANDGFHLWSEIYEGSLSDEFKVQEEIAKQVVQTLEGRNGESLDNELTKKHTSSGIAYQRYLQGLYHKHSTNPHNLV
jgi:serine/threonine-protein kinase